MGGAEKRMNKVPDQLKLVRGTLRADRQIANSLKGSVCKALPLAPVEFDDKPAAKKLWGITTSSLYNNGMLYEEDIIILHQYCYAAHICEEAQKMLSKQSIVGMSTNKAGHAYQHKNVWFDVWRNAVEVMLKIGREFGFSPVARTRISMIVGNGKNDRDAYMFGE